MFQNLYCLTRSKNAVLTCGDDPGEDPALSVLDRPHGLRVLLQYGHAARPLKGLRAVVVLEGGLTYDILTDEGRGLRNSLKLWTDL